MSSKPSSGPSKTRSSTSRTRKTPSTRTKTARTGTDTGMEQPVDETVQDEAATPARKSTTRRSSTASTTRKKSTTPTAKTAAKATASKKKAEPFTEEETPAEKPKRATTRRRSVKNKTETPTETIADAAPTEEEPAAKPVRRTRRKTAQSTTTTQADAAENAAEETADSPKPAVSRKTTTRKTVSTKKATTSRSRRTTKTEPAPSVEPDKAEAAEAVTPSKTTRTRRKKAETAETAAEAAAAAAAAATKKPRKTAKTKAAPAESETTESAEPAEAPARPTRRRTTRKKTAPVGTEAELQAETTSVEEEAPAKPARRRRSSSKTAAKQATPAVETAEEAKSATTPEAPVEAAAEGGTETEKTAPRFSDLALSAPILKAVDEMGYTHPTPIQAQAIPEILAGHDVLGVAQTGTGKTASFTLPLLEKLSKSRARARMPRSLILEPTRELALQVAENFEKYGAHLRLNHALLIGGGKMNEQRDLLHRGVDVLIATPGRLLDMFERGGLLMTQTDLLVIDEADRMLDMGFIPDIERIVSLLPRRRQTLFFSATMAPEIRRLADNFLNHPKEITVARQSSVANTITEGLLVVEKKNKNRALSALLRQGDVQNAIVFCNRKRDVDMLQSYLTRQKFAVGHLHGDLTQTLRFETLERFRSGELQILVCSDVAARGIDIGGLSHVFNYDLPFNAEDYVHRIGRTGRAGKEGKAYSLATPDEHKLLDAVETLTGKTIEPVEIKGFRSLDWREEDEDNASPARDKGRGRSRGSKPDDTREAEELKKQERAPRKKQVERNPMPEARKHDHRRGRAELLPPVLEKNGMQDGFGENVPAFMKVSFVPEPRDPSES